jgi:hypothetical protein
MMITGAISTQVGIGRPEHNNGQFADDQEQQGTTC